MKVPLAVSRLLRRSRNGSCAKCKFCGKRSLKEEMYQDEIYGWFCNEEEVNQFWKDSQW